MTVNDTTTQEQREVLACNIADADLDSKARGYTIWITGIERDMIVAALRANRAVTADETRERVIGALHDLADTVPEKDETWESWYAAAFDLAITKVSALLNRKSPGKDLPQEVIERAIRKAIDDCSTTDFYDISQDGLDNLAMLSAQAVRRLLSSG